MISVGAVVALLTPLALISGAVYLEMATRTWTRESWEALEGLAGLERSEGAGGEQVVSGDMDGVQVQIRERLDGAGEEGGVMVAFRVGPVPADLVVEPAGMHRGWEPLEHPVVGAADFDAAFETLGQGAVATARLDGTGRGILLALPRRISIRDGWLQDAPMPYSWPLNRLTAGTLEALVALARALQGQDGDVAALLAQRARQDPDPGVRQAALRWLGKQFRQAPAFRVLVGEIVASQRGAFRFEAASMVDDARHWETVARDAHEDADLRAQALARLGGVGEGHQVDGLLREVLGGEQGVPDALRLMALELLARPEGYRLHDQVQVLCDDLLREDGRAWLRLSAARDRLAEALLAHATADDEDRVVALLPTVGEDAFRGALSWLHRSGTLRSVEPLVLLREARRGSARRWAKEAIEAIQARQADAGAGRLTLAPMQGGEVTVARGSGGGLSTPED